LFNDCLLRETASEITQFLLEIYEQMLEVAHISSLPKLPSFPMSSAEYQTNKNKQTQMPESASELHRPRDRHWWAKLVTTVTDTGCYVIIAAVPYSRTLGFLDRNSYVLFQAAPHLFSRD
jgi:hypothetical protein